MKERMNNMDKTIGLYVHIPFCVQKCPYCAFNSIGGPRVSGYMWDACSDAVLRDLSFHIAKRPGLSDRALETLYIGGGTPSLMPAEYTRRLIDGIRRAFPVSSGQSSGQESEITIEINPGTITQDKLVSFKNAGINRLSIGVQSFHEKGLQALGRAHSVRESLRCYELARMAGFHNIGIDLMFGIPGQSLREWEADVDMALSLRPEHLAIYNLTIEEGTLFSRQYAEGRLLLPSEDEQTTMYELGIDRLRSAGYWHYEVSNFSLSGFECRHNNRYWLAMDYIGLGAGAHSYVSAPGWGVRWWNESDPLTYIGQIRDSGHATAGMERLTHEEAIEEGIFLGLRKIRGIDLDWFKERFHISLSDSHRDRLTTLEAGGLLDTEDHWLRLTPRGILIADTITTSLI